MTLENFGPFASMFQATDGELPAYLSLLHLESSDAETALRQVQLIIQEPKWERFATRLLLDPNWRPHLVACAALICRPKQEVMPALWQAFDTGSWVAPQLAVTAYFSDIQFVERAKFRIDTGCSVTPPRDLSPLERHSATGPAGTAQRSAKNMASLLNLCGRRAGLSSWVANTRAQPTVIAMLRCDENGDKSANIVDHWFRRISELAEQQGISLCPIHIR